MATQCFPGGLQLEREREMERVPARMHSRISPRLRGSAGLSQSLQYTNEVRFWIANIYRLRWLSNEGCHSPQIGLTLVCGVARGELLSHHPSSFPSHLCLHAVSSVPTGLVSVGTTGNTGDVWFVWSNFFDSFSSTSWLTCLCCAFVNSLVTEVWALRKACPSPKIWQRSLMIKRAHCRNIFQILNIFFLY